MKVKTTGKNLPHAWVVSPQDRGRKKIYSDNKIFLNDNDEFEIELYNPTQNNVLALISLDGKPISSSGLLVRNGERIYLDCFLDDNNKFKFSTYNVEDTKENGDAISKNGLLEAFFYNEEISEEIDLSKLSQIQREEHHHHHYYPNWNHYYPYGYPKIWYTNSGNTTLFGSSLDNTSTIGTTATYNTTSDNNGTVDLSGVINSNANLTNVSSNEIETGQTVKGDVSEQVFKEIEMKFEENHISNVSYKLLPETRKPKTAKDVSKANMEKVSDKISEGEYIQDFISRLFTFNDIKEKGYIEKDEFELIRNKTVKSIIKISSETDLEHIDDLASHIISLGDLMEQKMITEEEFNLIKSNLFNQVK